MNTISDEILKKEYDKLYKKFVKGNFSEVIKGCNKIIKKRKHQLFFNLLSVAYQKNGEIEKSIDVMREALVLNPNHPNFLNNIGTCFYMLHKYSEAEKYFKKGLEIDNQHLHILNNLGNIKRETYKIEESIEYYKKVLNIQKDAVPALFNLVGIYRITNQKENSKLYCKKILELNKKLTDADRQYSLVHKYTENDPHLNEMLKKISDDDLNNLEKIHLYYGVHKAYEDIQDYKNAFKFLKKGNELLKKETKYNFKQDEKKIKSYINLYKKIKSIKTSGVHRDLIFIVGMPRSGSSLIEQILASHKKVFGGGEIPYIQKIAIKMINEKRIDASLIDIYKNDYLDLIAELNDSDPVFTDKELLNFFNIGLILSLFPKAKIINCTRDPIDNCWSIYKNYFPIKTQFVNDFKDITKFYKLYLNTMAFWQKEFPKNIFNINYETLVENPKDQIKKILNFCNLEWDENVMSHHKNSRIIRTLSFDQANKPISKKVSNTIKNYKSMIGDLIKEF
ncbi:tetratricopeptide repeat-containing sulfotransferase family protein [Candidatus Pelagibacter communis]|uniref:tetratricopeptide repeat-containing sulfotransferase family protein n=1 Tax=Pelagibacter ubique TaxID=198252 RepID=UPI00094CF170|nr:sulfotransferase [Candidatus Pelagibacter ubique]